MREFLGECRKGIFEIKAYYPSYINDFVMSFIIFYIFFLTKLGEEKSYILNFIYWFLLDRIISEGAIATSQEKQTGTINQLLTKPISYFKILIYKNVFNLFFSLVQILIILLFSSNMIKILGNLNMYTLLTSLFYFVSLVGIGLAIASLTLLNAKIGNFTSIISYLFLFMSGGVVSFTNLPKWIEITNNLQPLGVIIKFTNLLLNQGYFSYKIFFRLIIISIIYYGIGYYIFKKVYKYSKKNGVSNRY